MTKASKRTDSKQTDGMLVKLRAKSSSEKKKREQAEKDRARKIAERKRLEAGKEAKKKAQRAKDKKGVRHCILTEVPEFVDIARQEGKIPFIIDHERKYSRFNEYQNVIPLMMKKYIVEVYVKKGMTKEEAREEMREKLISSMKHGSMLQIDLGETAPDLLKDFCGLETFPTELVLTPGSLDELENVKPLLREQDYDEHGIWAPRGKIEVVVTTDFAVAEYAEFLEDSIPLNKLSPIHIMPEAFRK